MSAALSELENFFASRGAVVISIRPPTQISNDADPRHPKDMDKWIVSWKSNDFRIDWHRGKPSKTLQAAFIAAFGELPPASDEDLLV